MSATPAPPRPPPRPRPAIVQASAGQSPRRLPRRPGVGRGRAGHRRRLPVQDVARPHEGWQRSAGGERQAWASRGNCRIRCSKGRARGRRQGSRCRRCRRSGTKRLFPANAACGAAVAERAGRRAFWDLDSRKGLGGVRDAERPRRRSAPAPARATELASRLIRFAGHFVAAIAAASYADTFCNTDRITLNCNRQRRSRRRICRNSFARRSFQNARETPPKLRLSERPQNGM